MGNNLAIIVSNIFAFFLSSFYDAWFYNILNYVMLSTYLSYSVVLCCHFSLCFTLCKFYCYIFSWSFLCCVQYTAKLIWHILIYTVVDVLGWFLQYCKCSQISKISFLFKCSIFFMLIMFNLSTCFLIPTSDLLCFASSDPSFPYVLFAYLEMFCVHCTLHVNKP